MNEIAMLPKNELVSSGLSREQFDLLVDQWLGELRKASTTKSTYKTSIRVFTNYLETLENPTINRQTILDFLDDLEHGKDPRKPATINLYLTALKRFFGWLSIMYGLPDITKGIDGLKVSKLHKRDPLTISQTQELLNSIDRSTEIGKRDYALLCLLFTTGLRRVSVLEANIGDRRTINDQRVLLYRGKGRTEKQDIVKLTRHTEQALQEYLDTRKNVKADDPLFAGAGNKNRGKRLNPGSLSRIFKQRLRDINIDDPRLSLHAARHSFATNNLRAGATLEETAQVLSHTSISTTAIYDHSITRMDNNSEQRVEDLIFQQE